MFAIGGLVGDIQRDIPDIIFDVLPHNKRHISMKTPSLDTLAEGHTFARRIGCMFERVWENEPKNQHTPDNDIEVAKITHNQILCVDSQSP